MQSQDAFCIDGDTRCKVASSPERDPFFRGPLPRSAAHGEGGIDGAVRGARLLLSRRRAPPWPGRAWRNLHSPCSIAPRQARRSFPGRRCAPWTASRAPRIGGAVLMVGASQLPWPVAALGGASAGDCIPCLPLGCWRKEVLGSFPFYCAVPKLLNACRLCLWIVGVSLRAAILPLRGKDPLSGKEESV
jgi:hypothetical protein